MKKKQKKDNVYTPSSDFERRPVDNNPGSVTYAHNADKKKGKKGKMKEVYAQKKKHVSTGKGQ